MSASPVDSSDFPAVTSATSLCEGFKSLLRIPGNLRLLLDWMLDANDEPSEGFAAGLSKYLCPLGTVLPFSGESVPSDHWLIANGQAVSRTTYADLYTLIGTRYGAGDGSTTFNLPNLQGRFPRGRDASNVLGATGGADSITLTENQIPTKNHYHGVGEDPGGDEIQIIKRAWSKDGSYTAAQNSADNPNVDVTITDGGDLATSDAIEIVGANSEASEPFDNRPAYLTLYFIIKVK